MNLDDIFKIAGAILGSVGGAAAIIFGFSTWLGKVWAERILQKEKSAYSAELEQLKNQLQLAADKQKLIFSLYFEGQFKLYNDLWISLSELQQKVEQLWVEANNINLKLFVRALSKAKQQIRNSALLVESEHYKEIMEAIDSLENYKIGKEKLINARGNIENIPEWEIQGIVEENMHNRIKIALITDRMLDKMREQISGNV